MGSVKWGEKPNGHGRPKILNPSSTDKTSLAKQNIKIDNDAQQEEYAAKHP